MGLGSILPLAELGFNANVDWEKIINKIRNKIKVLFLPVQLTPFPEYPGLQVHTKDPLVFWQLAFSSQLWSNVSHSFIS